MSHFDWPISKEKKTHALETLCIYIYFNWQSEPHPKKEENIPQLARDTQGINNL
jgi:hypothetical protein